MSITLFFGVFSFSSKLFSFFLLELEDIIHFQKSSQVGNDDQVNHPDVFSFMKYILSRRVKDSVHKLFYARCCNLYIFISLVTGIF